MADENQAGPQQPEQPPSSTEGGLPPPTVPEALQAGAAAPPPQQPPTAPGGYYYAPYYGYPAQPPPRRKASPWPIILIVLAVLAAVGLLGFMFIGMMSAAVGGAGGGWALGGEQIGLVHITGLITGGGSASLFTLTTGSDAIVTQLERAADNDDIKAVLLRINSGGGSAAASQEIYHAITKYRDQTGRPVVASMSDVAASGAYYVASAADTIVADPGTLTGSIGVIMAGWEIEDLMEKHGIRDLTITSGDFKDTGSMFRHMRPDERQYMQEMLNDVLDQFISDVAAGRGMKKEEVKQLADGKIFTGRQAQKKKLVDTLGGLTEAVDEAKKAAGIVGEAQLVPLRERSPFEDLFGGWPYGADGEWSQFMALRRMSPATHLLEHPWLGPES